MINSWSLLYDELYGDETMIETATNKDYNDFWEQDGISMTGNPELYVDGYGYGAAQPVPLPGGEGQDVITFGSSFQDTIVLGNDHIQLNVPDLPTTDNNNGRWKYHEDEIIKEITDYVGGTYRSHYTGTANGFKDIQTIDLMAAKGLASSFCQANILKYGSRYGAKDGKSKRDLLKVIHYAMLLLHFDEHFDKESDYPF